MLNNRKEFFAIQPLDGSKGWIGEARFDRGCGGVVVKYKK